MNDKEKSFLSVVAYVYNDETEIESFLELIYKEIQNNFEKFEIICIDDASTDTSVHKIKRAADKMKGTTVTILHMSYFHGIELAMNAGTDLSIGDYVYEFDTVRIDCNKSLIMQVFKEAQQGFDVVSASPKKRLRFSSFIFYKVINKSTSGKYEIRTETFRILSRRVINRISAMNKTVPYRKVVYTSSGLPMKTLMYKSVDRNYGIADKNIRAYRKGLAANTLILFTDLGYRFSMRMTFLMMAITILTALYTVVVYICGTPIEGWTTTMLFMSFAFFGLFGILTIVVKYLSIIVDLVFKRQQYMIEGIEKITT